MNLLRPGPRLACLALLTSSLLATGHAQPAASERDLPESLRSGYVGPVIGPADDRAYAHGQLGLVRTSFGRASLYVAWRVMQLPPGALANESHARKGDWVRGPDQPPPALEELPAWLQAREAYVRQAPAGAPGYFRVGKTAVPGFGEISTETGQCGPDAFAFAARMLGELAADTLVTEAQRQEWIAGQDAVFARCTWSPGQGAAPALPGELPASAPARLRQLRAYQRASALFYGDEYAAARQAFDEIATTPGHPMRAWAALGALRAILRDAVRDAEWEAAFQDAWTKRQLRGPALTAALAEPAARRRQRVDAAFDTFEARAKAALADPSLAAVHGAVRYTWRRALMQLAPAVPLGFAMQALDQPQNNPYTMGAIDLFQELFPRLSPDRPSGDLAARLRQHAWLDFILAVQACTDTPGAVDAAACDAEHAHAMARWKATTHNAWLLAALMTARQPSAADVVAADVARSVPASRPEWASLQVYAARVLRSQGRGAEADAALDAVLASPALHRRDRPFVEAQRRMP